MKHSRKFNKVKHYYDTGLWDISKVRDSVEHGWITAEEFTEITGEHYKEE